MRIKLPFKTSDQRIPVTFREVQYIETPAGSEDPLPDYEGEIVVTPSFASQILPTKGTSVNADIEVLPIQITTISNPSGGKTISI